MESTDSLLLSVDLFIFIPSSNQYGNQSIGTTIMVCQYGAQKYCVFTFSTVVKTEL